jgi:hypothetical protein
MTEQPVDKDEYQFDDDEDTELSVVEQVPDDKTRSVADEEGDAPGPHGVEDES